MMPLIEFMGQLIENLEIGDPIEIFLTQDKILFRKIYYDPKTQLFKDYGWMARLKTKKQKARSQQISLSVFLFPNKEEPLKCPKQTKIVIS